VLEYDPLLDSSNMTFDDYVHLANDIYVCNMYFMNVLTLSTLNFYLHYALYHHKQSSDFKNCIVILKSLIFIMIISIIMIIII